MRAYTANYQKAGGKRAFSDYYTAAYGGALFDRSLVENVTFADHSLATDSVFSETQLISLPQRDDLFQQASCRTACSACSTSRCATAASSALGSKESIDFSAYADALRAAGQARAHVPRSWANDAAPAHAASWPARGIEAVVIGASAGGVDALLALLPRPAAPATRCRWSPCCTCRSDRESRLAELFAARLAVPVRGGAPTRQPIAPGTVYFAAAGLPSVD